MDNPESKPGAEDSKGSYFRSINWDMVKKKIFSIKAKQAAIACLIGVMLMGGGIYYFNQKRIGYAVKYNGKVIGYVRDEETAKAALNSATEEIRRKDPDINMENSLEFEKIQIDSDKITNESTLEKEIETDLCSKNTSYAIIVNDTEEAIVACKEDADKVVQGIKKHFGEEETKKGAKVLDIKIKDNIDIQEKVVNSSKRVDVETAVQKLVAGKGTTKKYQVKSGDSIWRIARDNDMKISEISQINPGLDINKLMIGDELNLAVSEPSINVETTVEAYVDEKIPFKTTYKNDSNLVKGKTKIIENGQYGTNRTTKKVTKLNGKEIASSVLSTAVIKSPVNQVMAKGMKVLTGSGQFRWPLNGRVTSSFGSRGREFHKGMDIGAPGGTPIYAADGGKVIQAGWCSGYGKLVIIDHGNGYQTYYGHCSSIQVSTGQSVSRGQRIASVGQTGNAYGNHLHFEVRKNGSVQNPAKYLSR